MEERDRGPWSISASTKPPCSHATAMPEPFWLSPATSPDENEPSSFASTSQTPSCVWIREKPQPALGTPESRHRHSSAMHLTMMWALPQFMVIAVKIETLLTTPIEGKEAPLAPSYDHDGLTAVRRRPHATATIVDYACCPYLSLITLAMLTGAPRC